MSYSQTWLEDPASIRVVLVIATALRVSDSQEVPFYFSTAGYVTTDNIAFNPLITGTVGFQESISEEGSISMSFGDIELHNLNGDLDLYLNSNNYVWSNRSIKIYYGDPGWKYSLSGINSTNYLMLFDGVIDDIDSRTTRSVNFRVRDKLEKLNGPISENKIGTYGVWPAGQQNKDTSRPIVFGEVFNITPVLINPATLEYVYSSSNPEQVTDASQVTTATVNGAAVNTYTFTNNGSSGYVLEIRDNGVPIYKADTPALVGATIDQTTSTFKLLKAPAGTITCSVQGVKKAVTSSGVLQPDTYLNSIPSTIAVIVTQFGKSLGRLTLQELDMPSFNAFNSTAEIGIFIQGSDNLLSVCQDLASSLGGQLIISRTGLLRLIQFGVPLAYIPSTTITVNDIIYDSLAISRRPGVKAAIKLAYAKNYTVQQNLLSFIPDEHKANFEKEWLTVTAYNPTIKTTYKVDVDPLEKATSLISTEDAAIEAARLNAYYDEQRTVYSFTGKAKLLSLNLGQGVILNHHRFGLNSVSGQVIRLSPNWNKEQIEVEVIV